jgi:hypothetical protein
MSRQSTSTTVAPYQHDPRRNGSFVTRMRKDAANVRVAHRPFRQAALVNFRNTSSRSGSRVLTSTIPKPCS